MTKDIFIITSKKIIFSKFSLCRTQNYLYQGSLEFLFSVNKKTTELNFINKKIKIDFLFKGN